MNLAEKNNRQKLRLVNGDTNEAWERDIDLSCKGIIVVTAGSEDCPATDRDMEEIYESFRQELKNASDQKRDAMVVVAHGIDVKYINMG